MKDDQQKNEAGDVLCDRYGRLRARFVKAVDEDSDDILLVFDNFEKPFAVIGFPEVGTNGVGLLDGDGNSVSVSMIRGHLAVVCPNGDIIWPLGGSMVGPALAATHNQSGENLQ